MRFSPRSSAAGSRSISVTGKPALAKTIAMPEPIVPAPMTPTVSMARALVVLSTPVALAAALHVDAVVPNFLIQEQIDASLGDGLLYEPWLVRDGHIDLPTRPGLGFEIDEREAEQNRAYQEELGGEFYDPADGSVADW